MNYLKQDVIRELARKMCRADGFDPDMKCFPSPAVNGPRGSYVIAQELLEDSGHAWHQYSALAEVAVDHFWEAFARVMQPAPVAIRRDVA